MATVVDKANPGGPVDPHIPTPVNDEVVDYVAANDNTFTGDNTHEGTETFSGTTLIDGDLRSTDNIIEMVNGTTAQELRVYHTKTSASVYERGMMRWASNILEIGTQMLGATLRSMKLVAQSVTINTAGSDRVNFGSSGMNPFTDAAYGFGTITARYTNLFLSGYMTLGDGVTAPTATSGTAKLYVDTADGDLKIIFGDGTIKTIVVDT